MSTLSLERERSGICQFFALDWPTNEDGICGLPNGKK